MADRREQWSYWSRRRWLEDNDSRKEIPVSFFGGWWNVPIPDEARPNLTGTDIEALMSTAPGHEPVDPTVHYGDPYTMLDGMDITEFERAVLDAIVMAGLSYRQAGRELGVPHSTVFRTYKSLIIRIRSHMGDNYG